MTDTRMNLIYPEAMVSDNHEIWLSGSLSRAEYKLENHRSGKYLKGYELLKNLPPVKQVVSHLTDDFRHDNYTKCSHPPGVITFLTVDGRLMKLTSNNVLTVLRENLIDAHNVYADRFIVIDDNHQAYCESYSGLTTRSEFITDNAMVLSPSDCPNSFSHAHHCRILLLKENKKCEQAKEQVTTVNDDEQVTTVNDDEQVTTVNESCVMEVRVSRDEVTTKILEQKGVVKVRDERNDYQIMTTTTGEVSIKRWHVGGGHDIIQVPFESRIIDAQGGGLETLAIDEDGKLWGSHYRKWKDQPQSAAYPFERMCCTNIIGEDVKLVSFLNFYKPYCGNGLYHLIDDKGIVYQIYTMIPFDGKTKILELPFIL